jgi:hypothetical protein
MLTLFAAFGSAPLSRSSRTTSRWPYLAETVSAVSPSYERQTTARDHNLLQKTTVKRTELRKEHILYTCIELKYSMGASIRRPVDAMQHTSSVAFGSAPLSRSSSTISRWPFWAENMRAVFPFYERHMNSERPWDAYNLAIPMVQFQRLLRKNNYYTITLLYWWVGQGIGG